jgi:ATP-binding cassette subfamily B protein
MDDTNVIPAGYWMARPAKPSDDGDEQVTMTGAVLVQVRGRRAKDRVDESSPAISAELAAALEERPCSPSRELFGLLRKDGILAPMAVLAALAVAAGAVLVEAVLFQGLFNFSPKLNVTEQRLGAIVALAVFSLAMFCLELPIVAGLLRSGRQLEARLRLAFLEKIPRLSDRYFQSRLMSDMTERSHMIHRIRHLPDLGGQMVRSVLELALTAVGIAWLDPRLALLAAAAAISAILLPLLAQPTVIERDLRVRTHSGALSRYYLDALLGLVPIQVHGAQRAVRREHRGLLAGWADAGLGLQTVAVWFEATQFAVGFGLAAAMLFLHLARSAEAGAVLLLIYWALNLPVLGQQIAQIAWQYPAYRNRTLRLLEPLGALEEEQAVGLAEMAEEERAPVAISLDNVTMRAAGHTILRNITIDIGAGAHVAIVGPSGAGKSSLVGLLLGWSRPAAGDFRAGAVGRKCHEAEEAEYVGRRSGRICHNARRQHLRERRRDQGDRLQLAQDDAGTARAGIRKSNRAQARLHLGRDRPVEGRDREGRNLRPRDALRRRRR